MTRPLVIAGAGYTGARLARRQRHRRPLAIVSTPASAEALEVFGIDAVSIDLDNAAAIGLPSAGPADVVYLVPPGPAGSTGDERLQGFLAALGSAHRLIYLSTTGVYGDRDGAAVDEDAQPAPLTQRARRRVAAEGIVRRWCEANDAGWIVLRVPGIYGPGRLQLRTLAAGVPVLRSEDAPPGNRIHVDDLVGVIEAVLQSKRRNRIYNVGDGNHATQVDFLRIVAEFAGLPAPVEVPMQIAEASFEARRMSYLQERRRVDTQRMRDELGFRPAYPYAEAGIRASLIESGQLLV